jgi:ADP-glucose pyrophosphorylase
LLLNGDAIFNFNVLKIFDLHFNNNKNITFIGSQTQLAYGTIGVINDKVKSFERNITFNAVLKKNLEVLKDIFIQACQLLTQIF